MSTGYHDSPERPLRTKLQDGMEIRYSRRELLGLYCESLQSGFLASIEEIKDVSISESQKPILSADRSFAHPLGDQINSRFSGKDWARESSKLQKSAFFPVLQPQAPPPPLLLENPRPVTPPRKDVRPLRVILSNGSRNVPVDFQLTGSEVRASNSQRRLEEGRKSERESNWDWGNEVREVRLNPDAKPWVGSLETKQPKYHVSLLQEKQQCGDPFAPILLNSGQPDSHGFLSIPNYSRASQRLWYYRDPQGTIQGPFSSVDMFNWNAAGYFAPDLLVAASVKSQLAPLSSYSRCTSKRCTDSEAFLRSLLGVQTCDELVRYCR